MKTAPILQVLARRLSLIALLALLLASAIAGAWSWNDEFRNVERNVEQIEAAFARPVGEAVRQGDVARIEALLELIGSLEGVTRARVSTQTGRQYAVDQPSRGALLQRQIALQHAGRDVGRLEVTVGSERVLSRVVGHMKQILAIVVVFIAVSGLVFFLTVRRALAEPLMRLAKRVASYTPDGAPRPIELDARLGQASELRQLALAFNRMQDEIGRRLRDAQTLNAQVAELAAQREERLSYIEALDDLLLAMSSSMISLPSAQIEPELKQRLAALAEHLHLDRIDLLQLDEPPGTVTTHTLYASPQRAEAAPDPAVQADPETRLGPWLRTRMASGAGEATDDLGGPLQDPFGVLARFRAEGLGAIVSVPLTTREGSHGLLLFGVAGVARQWREAEVNGLKLTAQITAGALNQQRMLDQLAESRRHLEANNRMLERLSRTDALTGLGNRRAFDEAREREFARAQRHAVPLSLILLDIDHFKVVNDRLGHNEGDRYLRQFAGLLPAATKRAGEVAARIGGEEFAILLPGTDEAGALALAEDIARRLARLALPHPGNVVAAMSVSIGVAQFDPQRHATVDAWFADCDAALYTAKAGGRNRIESAAAIPAALR